MLINGVDQSIELGDGGEMPCAIYINNEVTLFGRAAMAKAVNDPGNLYTGLMNIAGKRFTDDEMEELKNNVRYHVCGDESGRCVLLVRKNSNQVPTSPTELIAMIMSHVVDTVRMKGYTMDSIMVSYPLQCGAAQVGEILTAAKRTGVDHVDIVSEASIACLHNSISPYRSDCCALVINSGRRTTDFSVISTHDGVFDVLLTYGLPDLGGEDFTTAIGNKAMEDLKMRGVDVSRFSERKRRDFWQAVETIKVGFSSDPEVKDLCFSGDGEESPYSISEASVKVACHNLLKRCEDALRHVLEEVKKNNVTITHVVLSGGGMNLRCLSERLCSLLKARIASTNDRDVVVCGAAFAAVWTQNRVADR